MNDMADTYNLNRFLQAQESTYDRALAELKNGRKRTHWIWFIFPQIQGLAFSANSAFYAIGSTNEAKAYLDHPVLGSRLIECAEAVLRLGDVSIVAVMGSPDDMKLKSCCTLFERVAAPGSVFGQLLDAHYDGERDGSSLELLNRFC